MGKKADESAHQERMRRLGEHLTAANEAMWEVRYQAELARDALKTFFEDLTNEAVKATQRHHEAAAQAREAAKERENAYQTWRVSRAERDDFAGNERASAEETGTGLRTGSKRAPKDDQETEGGVTGSNTDKTV